MRVAYKLAGLLLSIPLCGCAKHAVKTNPFGNMQYTVGSECKISLVMTGCDTASPPQCKWIKAKYNPNCEKISLSK